VRLTMKSLEGRVISYGSGVLVLIALLMGMDAFLFLYLARATSALVLAIVSVQTWRTIWGRYSRN
jgi:hypothetical protein